MIDSAQGRPLVPVTSSDGQRVGTVALPTDIRGTLVVESDTEAEVIEEVVSLVLDVTVVGENGELITSFDEPIELCFETDQSEGDVCLGFYNDNEEWECEDYCLESTSEGVCGETRHLTSFALLLDSSAGSADKCGSGSTDYLYVYLSVSFVVAALIVVVIGALIGEYQLRSRLKFRERSLRSIEKTGALSTD